MRKLRMRGDQRVFDEASAGGQSAGSGVAGGDVTGGDADVAAGRGARGEAEASVPVTTRPRYQDLCERLTGSGPARELLSPIDGSVLGVVPTHTLKDLEVIAATARQAQRAWAATSWDERVRIVRAFSRMVLRRRAALLDVVQAETAKARIHALEEVLDVSLVAAHYARVAPRALRPRRRMGAIPVLTSAREVRHPKGVVGVIAPWNYPFTLAASDAIPAILAGNAVILKPDSATPLSALMVATLLEEAGLPAGVFQVLNGPGATVGDALIDEVDFMMFTGSTATGRRIGARCGERLIGFSAELGGKNPMIVTAGANVEAAASGAVRACFSNAGQLCISIERIYVSEAIVDEFVEAFVGKVCGLRLGVGGDWRVDVGGLISADHLVKVQAHVDDAVAKGARVLAGGRARPDLGPTVFEPTVLMDVPASAAMYAEETFGPVVAIYPVADVEEAIELANDSTYGLNASVWGRGRLPWLVAEWLEVGTVNINEGYAATWATHGAPMGGWKDSGLGRRHGREGIEKYTEVQTIARQRLMPLAPMPGMSNEAYDRAISTAVRALNFLRGA
ncbi:succinic semialdehyde dehydrogenase [Schaalia sp. Marseille-Q2122]|uniref:succinic semialdehyde dehydrogenase n=1 Tax=Schaalia sp. Marseille-Q2122 TaxID=2736604 RepID=UPI00158BDE18|nr:succinic semialdehyde dehydrogenase [Schaalia sp. Marseille-Q2122]